MNPMLATAADMGSTLRARKSKNKPRNSTKRLPIGGLTIPLRFRRLSSFCIKLLGYQVLTWKVGIPPNMPLVQSGSWLSCALRKSRMSLDMPLCSMMSLWFRTMLRLLAVER
jgi:hypothetical protein